MSGDPVQAFRAALLAGLGHAPERIEPGRFQRFATSERRADTAGWCKLFSDLRGGVFGCYRHGLSDTWTAADRTLLTPAQRADLARQVQAATAEREAQQRRQWAENAQRIRRLWAECRPLVPGDPATLYLKRRGFGGVWPLPGVLRLHRGLAYWHAGNPLGNFPALVAPLLAPDGRLVALHRTYLAADGRKADVPTVKKLTAAAGPLAGACIPLHPPAAGVLGIAEGIETALAAWCASGVPTVAAYCAGNLAAWRWPPKVQRLVIFADADAAGRDAAERLRARAFCAGLKAEVLAPSDEGSDWCDVWARRGVEVSP
ncbi:MAG: toprim domain-containing protein [Burkholderiaceae bacterium]|nr:toprim domain-containing protein [Burkholderiaceae bacterium]